MISNLYYDTIIYILLFLVLGLIFIYINNLKEKFNVTNKNKLLSEILLNDREVIDKISEIVRLQKMKKKYNFVEKHQANIENLDNYLKELVNNYVLKTKSKSQFIENQEIKYKKIIEDLNLKKLDLDL